MSSSTQPLTAFDTYVGDVIARLGGEIRPPQMEMITHVVDAIEHDRPVIIEAPTGTGKSLGYSLPAIFAARTMNKRVLIVTRTKKLQNQLASDLPRYIEAALGDNASKIQWANLKGRNHFTCEKRIKSQDAVLPVSLSSWAVNEGGSRDDAPSHSEGDWRAVSGGQDCVGKKCIFFDHCPSTLQRFRATDANIVIANQTLLGMNLAFDIEAIPGLFDIVIIDEAQHFENTIREQLANDLSPSELVKASFADAADELTRFLPSEGYRFYPGIEPGSILYNTYINAISQAKLLRASIDGDDNPKLEDKKELNLLTKITRALWAFTRPDENVLWVDREGMHSSPIDIKEIIRESLGSKSTIFTSATIPDNLGLDTEIVTIVGGYTNVGLYISDINGGGKYSFRPDAAQETLDLVTAIEGRSLLLYTSEVAMMDMYYWLRTRINVPVYHQKMPNAITRFRDEENSILLGIDTCWEGIDVPGSSLSLVVIDRLPFPNMGDPIYQDSVERYGWAKASIPPTKTMFRQGVGRLLRSAEDVGIVAVLDSRLKTKGYGKVLLNSITFQGIPTLKGTLEYLRSMAEDIRQSAI